MGFNVVHIPNLEDTGLDLESQILLVVPHTLFFQVELDIMHWYNLLVVFLDLTLTTTLTEGAP